jgi:outer membrane protein
VNAENLCLRWVIMLVLLLCLAPAATRAEDLMGIVQRAQVHDATYLAARRALDAAAERPVQAQAAMLPVVNASAGSNRQSGQVGFSGAAPVDRGVRNWNWNLQLTQPIWRPANHAGRRQAEAQYAQAQEQFRQAEQDLLMRAAQSYMEVLVAKEGLRAAGAYRTAVGQQLILAARNQEVGTGAITDVHEAKARRDAVQAQWVAARNDVELRTAELERLLGTVPDALQPLSATADLPPLPEGGLDRWLDAAREAHPAVRIQQAAVDVARAEAQRQQAGHSPTLDLVASYGPTYASGSMSSPADISSRVRSAQLGLNLTLPLYAGGAVQSRLREALALRAKAEEELEAARRQASTQARQAYAGLVNGHARVEALASAVRSSEEALTSNRIGYRIGTRINTDVLNAEQQLHAAQRDWHKARVDILLSGLRLKAATGQLSEADLAAINGLLASQIP